ncbi:hypothetical protein ACM792_08140 [Metapseudomonas otitidis]|uniref:hypothetical protein n=1 Tax=Metapseudomonas otitidis TaxID=319939 RepID=UPI0039FC8B4E
MRAVGAIDPGPILTVASAATTDIGAARANTLSISGTTGITSFGTAPAGTERWLIFQGVLTISYNAASMILPGLANITTAGGDTALFVSLGGGNWRCLSYNRVNGWPLAENGFGYNQAWQDVKSSRSLATTYTNSTGRAICVAVQAQMSSINGRLSFSINGAVYGESGQAYAATALVSIFAVVPSGATYSISAVSSASTVTYWGEMR